MKAVKELRDFLYDKVYFSAGPAKSSSRPRRSSATSTPRALERPGESHQALSCGGPGRGPGGGFHRRHDRQLRPGALREDLLSACLADHLRPLRGLAGPAAGVPMKNLTLRFRNMNIGHRPPGRAAPTVYRKEESIMRFPRLACVLAIILVLMGAAVVQAQEKQEKKEAPRHRPDGRHPDRRERRRPRARRGRPHPGAEDPAGRAGGRRQGPGEGREDRCPRQVHPAGLHRLPHPHDLPVQ